VAEMFDRGLDFIHGLLMMDPSVVDLSIFYPYYPIIAGIGFLLALYTMQLIGYEHEDMCDPIWLQWARRFGFAITALAFLWSTSYWGAHDKHPGPPAMILMFSIIFSMVIRVIAIHLRIRREGRRFELPNGRIVTIKDRKS
jgi:hypothetical protein